MRRGAGKTCWYQVIALDGISYAVVRENVLREVCRQAGITAASGAQPETGPGAALSAPELDQRRLAARLRQRRTQARLPQAALAKRAGIRVETLNRIERCRTTPDFATIRKLVVAMEQAEAGLARTALSGRSKRSVANEGATR